jgi:hypothetical protein
VQVYLQLFNRFLILSKLMNEKNVFCSVLINASAAACCQENGKISPWKKWWKNDVKVMKKWWKSDEKVMKTWWKNDGKVMKKWWWKSDENMMKKLTKKWRKGGLGKIFMKALNRFQTLYLFSFVPEIRIILKSSF